MCNIDPRHAGFTLVEVLVAAVVLAVGLLGVIAIQLGSLRAARSALAQTQAVALTTDLAEKIRARQAAPAAYDCEGSCEDGDGGDALAIADLDAWRAAVAKQLPGGAASVGFTAGSPATYRLEVNWADGGSATPGSHRLQLEVAGTTP